MLYQGLIGWFVQVVGNGALAQFLRLTCPLIHKVIGIHQFPGLWVVNVQFTTHEHIVHFRNVRVERLVGQYRQTKDQALGLQVNLPCTLVAELAADEAAVAFPLVFVHLLTETKRTRGERMAVLFTQGCNGIRHLFPVVFAAKQLLGGGSTLIQLDARVQHRGVHHILPDLLRRQVPTCLLPAMEKTHRLLVNLIVRAHPTLQMGQVTVGIEGLNLGSVVSRKTFNGNKGILTGCTTATTHHVDALTARHLLVVGLAYNTTVHQFPGAYAQPVSVILHNQSPVSCPVCCDIIAALKHT